MKSINFTIDNYFRHPLRWGKCPMNIHSIKVFGFIYNRRPSPTSRIDIWYLNMYFYKWVWTISNRPLN